MPDVSVIVPIYNSEDTIAVCIQSILSQTFTNLEIILVDDGSSDKSGNICDDYAIKDNRILVIHQPNQGRSRARSVGVENAHGEWITFVDSDDTLPETAIALLYEKTDSSTDIILGNGYTLPNEHRDVIPMSDFRHLTVRGEGTIGVPWGSLYRKVIVTPYLFDLPCHIINGEDYIFWLRLVFLTDRPVKIVYQSVYNKGEEHTSNIFKWTADYCYELNEYRKSAIPQDQYDEYLPDMIQDRLANMFAVAVCQSRKEWKNSKYYLDILCDMKLLHSSFSIKQLLFLHLPSLKLRKFCSYISSKT